MTEQEWRTSTDPRAMMTWLVTNGGATERGLHLFACACVRRIWSLVADGRSRKGVEVRERFEDGQATREELSEATNAARQARAEIRSPFRFATPNVDDQAPEVAPAWAAGAASTAASGNPGGVDMAARAAACVRGTEWQAAYTLERAAQADLLRDIFGTLFRPVTVDPYLRAWHDGLVVNLAKAAYEDRDLPAGTLKPDRLAVLADALEEAGCTHNDLLQHLRGPGPHIRGCFAIDAILDKK